MINQKQIILHIGQTKTGTTSIQEFLHKNQKNLEESNIFYARRPGQVTSHRYLFHLICASISKLQYSNFSRHHLTILQKLFEGYNFSEIDQYWEYFTNSLFDSSCNISIISEELLWELGKFKVERELKLEMIQTLANALHKVVDFENITILASLRHHADWLESWHNQMVKDQGNQTKIKPFLERELRWGSLNYAQNLNDWLHIFPQANFKVLDFKKSLVSSRPIGITFLKEAGLINYLKLENVVNFIYPDPQQESIHPLLHAYIIRNKPIFDSLPEYNSKLKKANKIVNLIVKSIEIDHSYTLINPSILKICTEIYNKDDLTSYGITELYSSLSKKILVTKILPREITERLEILFN